MNHESTETPAPGPRAGASPRRWRDVIADEGRLARQRVVPLPLTLAALMLPFLAAWATAAVPLTGPAGDLARPLPEPLTALSRESRLPEQGTGYVDVWGPLRPWEEAHLARRRR